MKRVFSLALASASFCFLLKCAKSLPEEEVPKEGKTEQTRQSSRSLSLVAESDPAWSEDVNIAHSQESFSPIDIYVELEGHEEAVDSKLSVRALSRLDATAECFIDLKSGRGALNSDDCKPLKDKSLRALQFKNPTFLTKKARLFLELTSRDELIGEETVLVGPSPKQVPHLFRGLNWFSLPNCLPVKTRTPQTQAIVTLYLAASPTVLSCRYGNEFSNECENDRNFLALEDCFDQQDQFLGIDKDYVFVARPGDELRFEVISDVESRAFLDLVLEQK